MRTTITVQPLQFPRTVLPFGSVARGVIWFTMILGVALLMCAMLHVRSFQNIAFLFLIGFLCSIPGAKLTEPADLEILHVDPEHIRARIKAILERPKLGVRYFERQGSLWELNFVSWFYPWDPAIKVNVGASSVRVLGPHLSMLTIERELQGAGAPEASGK